MRPLHVVRLLHVHPEVQGKHRLAQRGTWLALVACALFAVACTRGGPHPEPPTPRTPGSGPDMGEGQQGDGGVGVSEDAGVPRAGSGGSASGAAGTGGGGGAPDDDCPGDADAEPCDEDAGALR